MTRKARKDMFRVSRLVIITLKLTPHPQLVSQTPYPRLRFHAALATFEILKRVGRSDTCNPGTCSFSYASCWEHYWYTAIILGPKMLKFIFRVLRRRFTLSCSLTPRSSLRLTPG